MRYLLIILSVLWFSCESDVNGCTDSEACNINSNANSDDNTWIEEQISKLSVLNINGLVIPGVNDPKSFSKLYNLIKKYNNNLEIIPLIESVEGLDNMKDLIRGFNLFISNIKAKYYSRLTLKETL